MLVTSHVAAASLISRRIRRPEAAFVAGIVSHLVMDRLPHWGTRDERLFLAVARVDGIVGLALLAHLSRRRDPVRIAAMAGAVLPDLDKPAMHLLGHRMFPRRVARWLASIQDESPDRLTRELLRSAGLAAAAVLSDRRERRRAR